MAIENEWDVSALIPRFLSDVRERLALLEQGLVALESAPEGDGSADAINTLFRAAHTIKGSSRMMGYQAAGNLAHALEDVLGALREKHVTAEPALVDGLLQAVDQLRQLIDQPPDTAENIEPMVAGLRRLLPADETTPAASDLNEAPPPEPSPSAACESPAPPPAAQHAPAPPRADDTVRVSVSRLDQLLRLTGELIMGGQRAQQLERRSLDLATGVQALLSTVDTQPSGTAASDTRPDVQKAEALRQASRSLAEQMDTWRSEHYEGTRLLTSATERLEQEVMALCLLPIGTVFAGLPRLVRGLAREHEKQVQLSIEGEDTELDRRILQSLNEPLLHLIRNAVDHGIEATAARVQVGKPPHGTITVRAFRQGGQVRIDVADDGQGMSPQHLREAAVCKKLLTADQAAALDDQAALDLIYRPGFSSSTFATSTSGRGVGMEAVKTSVSKLGGTVEMSTDPGRGTRFTLRLPITLTLTRALLVETNSQTCALPLGAIERILSLSPATIQCSAGREHVILDGQAIPLFRLGRLLGGSPGEPDHSPAVVVSASGQRGVIAVARVLDEREVVLKPLGNLLGRSTLASAVTLLAEGAVVPVLDPGACMRTSADRAEQSAAVPEAPPSRRILVVEDSPTTRELERSILVASGYEVETAGDGAQGWRKVQSGDFDLVLTDVDMPQMSGFELTETLRADERFVSLPVIILTSLEKETEKRRGLAAGAQAYMVKSSFNQTGLLDTIERLLA